MNTAVSLANFDEPELNVIHATISENIKSNELYKDVRALVTHYIDQFFGDKMMYCGGPIPKRLLHDPTRLTMVINFDISKGVKKAYNALENTITDEEIEEAKRIGDSTNDVKMVNETLKLLARASIPQQFAGGMMIMYLDLVEGVDFR